MKSTGFEDKLLAKLKKLDPDQVQNHLARLLAQKQFLQTIFDHLDEGVIVTSSELALLFANQRARAMLGWPRGKTYSGDRLTERLDRDHPLGDIIHSLEGHFRAITNYEVSIGAGQEERILSLSTLTMRSRGWKPASFGGAPGHGATATASTMADEDEEEETLLILLLRDVTERHRRQNEQARARRLASLATMTAGIAHEIKNPLNSLNIHAQLLKGELLRAREKEQFPDEEKLNRASEVILEETARLARIVEDFIQAARPRTPRLELQPIATVLEQAVGLFRAECERLGIELTIDVEPDLPPLLLDEHLFLQALRNLVRNAIEALDERMDAAAGRGEADFMPAIALRAELAGDFVNVTVADNGPGIAEGAFDQIFEPYFTTKFSGSGLGLMVVYRIVTEHRGALHVDTKPGEGARFVISIPIDQRPVRLLDHQAAEVPIIHEENPPESTHS